MGGRRGIEFTLQYCLHTGLRLVSPCITLGITGVHRAPDAKQVARRSLAHHFRGLGREVEPAALTVLVSLRLRLERLSV